MAIAGQGGWVPSNYARIVRGELVLGPITQNKPKDIICDVDKAVALLLAGQPATVDVRQPYMTELRRRIAEATGGDGGQGPNQE